jgi:hypothetical protein
VTIGDACWVLRKAHGWAWIRRRHKGAGRRRRRREGSTARGELRTRFVWLMVKLLWRMFTGWVFWGW